MDLSHDEAEVKSAQGRFVRLLIGLLAAYLFLITVHNDDFWPFSRFPMFSAAGRPWKRALLRELTPGEIEQPLLEVWENELPGRPLALHALAKNQDDLSQLVRRVESGMNPQDQQFLAEYLGDARKSRHMVLYLVRGSFRRRERTIRVRFRPVAVIGPEGVRAIPEEATQGPANEAGAGPPDAGAEAGGL